MPIRRKVVLIRAAAYTNVLAWGIAAAYLQLGKWFLVPLLGGFVLLGLWSAALTCPACGRPVLLRRFRFFGVTWNVWTSFIPRHCAACGLDFSRTPEPHQPRRPHREKDTDDSSTRSLSIIPVRKRQLLALGGLLANAAFQVASTHKKSAEFRELSLVIGGTFATLLVAIRCPRCGRWPVWGGREAPRLLSWIMWFFPKHCPRCDLDFRSESRGSIHAR
jgi:endogenous inhibitor of DNA gyrase (YacG/DUF329 family)